MMEEGVDPSYVPNDSGDSPLYMATHTNLDIKLLQKFIDYVNPKVKTFILYIFCWIPTY